MNAKKNNQFVILGFEEWMTKIIKILAWSKIFNFSCFYNQKQYVTLSGIKSMMHRDDDDDASCFLTT